MPKATRRAFKIVLRLSSIPRLRSAFHRLTGDGKGALHQQGKVGILQGVCQRVHLCPAGKIALHPVQKTGDGGLVLVKPRLRGGSCQRVGQRGQLTNTSPRSPCTLVWVLRR